MKLGKYKNASFFVKLVIWLGVLALSGLLYIIISALTMKGTAITPDVMRWLLVYQDIFIFVLPAILVACYYSSEPNKWLHMSQPIKWQTVIFAILLMAAALPASNLLAYLNEQIALPESMSLMEKGIQKMESNAEQIMNLLMGENTFDQFILNFIVIAILAAVGEEFCFRGVLQGLMKHTTLAIWVTAFVFSVIHMQFYGFIPRLLLGALFGYMMVWTKSIWIPIIMHCTNNGIIVILTYIGKKNDLDTEQMDAFGTGDTLWVGLLSMVLVAAGIYLLRRSMTIKSASSRTSAGN